MRKGCGAAARRTASAANGEVRPGVDFRERASPRRVIVDALDGKQQRRDHAQGDERCRRQRERNRLQHRLPRGSLRTSPRPIWPETLIGALPSAGANPAGASCALASLPRLASPAPIKRIPAPVAALDVASRRLAGAGATRSVVKILPVIMCGGAGTRVWPESRETLPKQFIPLVGDALDLPDGDRHAGRSGFRDPGRDLEFRVPVPAGRPTGADRRHGRDRARADAPRFRTGRRGRGRHRRGARAGHDRGHARGRPRGAGPRRSCRLVQAGGAMPRPRASSSRSASSRPMLRRATAISGPVRPWPKAVPFSRSRPLSRSPTARPRANMSRPAISGIPAISSSVPTSCSANSRISNRKWRKPRRRRLKAPTRISASKCSTRRPSSGRPRSRSTMPSWSAPKPRRSSPPISAGRMSAPGRPCGNCRSATTTTIPIRGHGIVMGGKNVHVRSDEHLTAVVGVDDVIVVTTQDAVLVLHREHGDRVKQLVDQLKREKRREADEHIRSYRPWGYYQSVDRGSRYQVKRIVVKPGAQLSLQKHFHRAEHWIVVKGTAEVVRNNETHLIHENEFDLSADRLHSPHGQSRQDRSRTDRGADGLLPRRRRHHPHRGHV